MSSFLLDINLKVNGTDGAERGGAEMGRGRERGRKELGG
jgi:hypothetical protein